MSIIHNALSGALAAQAGLAATSQNVANVMTPGYTRQGVLLASVHPLRSGALSAGSGVTVVKLLRFSDDYKSLQMWNAASELGRYKSVQPYLTQLEQVMGDDEAGIDSGLDAFFSALNAASVEPASTPLRQQVITAAESLAERFNSLNRMLAGQRAAIFEQRAATVAQVNTLAAQIADLNREIAATRGTGVNPSGLIDARDQKIDELASLVSLQVIDQPDGSRNVSLRSGQPLVLSGQSATLSVQTNPDGSQTVMLSFAQESFTVAGEQLGGQLGGLHALEQDLLVPMTQSVRGMAEQLAQAVNDQLAAGYTLAGTPGQPLFEYDAISGVLRIRDGVLPQDLAFSSSATEPGNSDNLLLLIGLRSQPVTVPLLGSVTLSDAASQLVGRLGTYSQQNQASLSTAETVRNHAEESWKSTSGVNTDEEAVNLMQYTQMYEANMKVIAIANELFDATLAMLR